jgi:geranylgeranyl pyrophosphate synthase
MQAYDYLKRYSIRADLLLNSFFKKQKILARKIDPDLAATLGVLQDYSQGGKKVRGALTVLGYEVCGGKNKKLILPVSVGIQLFHNFLLIHDDIIDRDLKRRGKPTIHAFYAKKKSGHFGESKAILIGDMAAFLGYQMVVSSDFPKEPKIRALKILNEFLLKTAYGQLLDIDYDFKKVVSWDEIMKVRTFKTAYYTIVMPLTIGAIFAGADNKVLSAIEKYGASVGIAYQLADDALGVFGSTTKTGKSNVSDIREGKKTFLYAKALEMGSPSQKAFLKRWYGAPGVDKRKASEIRRIIAATGSLEYSTGLAQELVNKGKKHIPQITRSEKYQKILENFADFVITRDV